MTTTLKCAHCGGDLGRGDEFCALCGVAAAFHDPFQLPAADPDSLRADMVERLRRATLGEFDLGRELGRGGMAAVYLAHEIALDRRVAIKVMAPGLLLGDGMVERFRHEAITIANLHHPNIVSIYSVRQAEGLHFFVMQYVPGRSLEQVIQRAGRLPLPVVRSILQQVGSALTYAHRRRVIHRDIKPGNILIDGEGNAFVSDFGIAKAAETPSRTMTGALVGTPAYMSPEQCRGAEVSGATDQYALGAVAYEMLVGEPPFGGSTFTVLQAHVERAPAPLRGRLPDCPPEVEAAILRMLAKDPAERFPRIADAMASLGAEPLADDDPLRLELTQLVATNASEPAATPRLGAPRTRSAVTHTTAGGTVGGVAILPPPADLEVGDSFVLVALVRGPNGTRLPSGSVSWGADPAGVLRFDPGGGTAIAVGPGTTLLTATCRGVTAELRIEVAAPRADEIVVEPPEHSVRAGDEIHLEASVRDKRGRGISRPVAWQTADPAIVTVTESGALLAQAPGLARITAVLDAVRTTITVPVLPSRVAAIHLGDRPPAVAGESFTLTATPVDRWGTPLGDRTVLWSSSDVRIAVVTAGGTLHALRPGPVVLTASCEGISESVRMNVAFPSPAPVPPQEGAAVPRRRLRRRRPQGLLAGSIGVGTVAGLIWLLGRADPLTVSAELPEPAGYVAYEPVRDTVPTGSIAITRKPGRALRPESGYQLAAEVRDGEGRPAPGAIRWRSTDTAVVRVHPENGWVRAVHPGQAHVVALSGDWRDSTRIVVRPAPAQPRAAGSVSIAPPGAVHVGESAMLRAAVLDTRGEVLENSAVTWRSNNLAVASVDSATGRLEARTPGSAVVVAESGPVSSWIELTVLPTAVAEVVVHGTPPLMVGQSATLRAVPTDAEGNSLRERPVIWMSSDPSVLEVDAGSGRVWARSPGSVDVTATSEGTSGRVRVTVFAPDHPAATGAASGEDADRGILAGVEECYAAIQLKDTERLAGLYHPVTALDQENLRRLRRILHTREWSALVGERVDRGHEIGATTAAVDFSVRLLWRDGAGRRHSSDPTIRASFERRGGRWTMTGCRIVGRPAL